MRARMHTRAALFAAWSMAVLFAACGDSSSDPLTPAANEILVGQDLNFNPPHLTVTAGTTVRWRNVGPFDHTITSGLSSKPADDPGADFDDEFKPGDTFEHTFDTLGDHPYFADSTRAWA